MMVFFVHEYIYWFMYLFHNKWATPKYKLLTGWRSVISANRVSWNYLWGTIYMFKNTWTLKKTFLSTNKKKLSFSHCKGSLLITTWYISQLLFTAISDFRPLDETWQQIIPRTTAESEATAACRMHCSGFSSHEDAQAYRSIRQSNQQGEKKMHLKCI